MNFKKLLEETMNDGDITALTDYDPIIWIVC